MSRTESCIHTLGKVVSIVGVYTSSARNTSQERMAVRKTEAGDAVRKKSHSLICIK